MQKFTELLKLLSPARRVYFIYTHKTGRDRFASGLTANTEISHHVFDALARRFPNMIFLRVQGEKKYRLDSIRSKDVVIGHVGETFLRASTKTKRLIAFYPWCGHRDRSENTLFNCQPLHTELAYWKVAASIIFLTSEYNKRLYIDSQDPYWHPHLKEKSVRVVHQPIDLKLFKRIKHTYTTSDFLYVGNDAHMKGLPEAKQLVTDCRRQLHLFGVDGKKLNNLDQQILTQIAAKADFFIQPGLWEAQCVSILEAAARGFIPIVSPETGYPYRHPFMLKPNDLIGNRAVLQRVLQLRPEEKKELADSLYKQLRDDPHHNSWSMLTEVLVEEVTKFYSLP